MHKEAKFGKATKAMQNWLKQSPTNPLIQKGITPKRTAAGSALGLAGGALGMRALPGTGEAPSQVTGLGGSSGSPPSEGASPTSKFSDVRGMARQAGNTLKGLPSAAAGAVSNFADSAGKAGKRVGAGIAEGATRLAGNIKANPIRSAGIAGGGLAGLAGLIYLLRSRKAKKEKRAGDDVVVDALLKIAEERYSRMAISSLLASAITKAKPRERLAFQAMKYANDSGQPLHVIVAAGYPDATPVDREKFAYDLCSSAVKYARTAGGREDCKHCGTMHEMGDDGKCNTCGKSGGYDDYEIKESQDWRDIWNAASGALSGAAHSALRTTMPQTYTMGRALTGGFSAPRQQGSVIKPLAGGNSVRRAKPTFGSPASPIKPKTPGQMAAANPSSGLGN